MAKAKIDAASLEGDVLTLCTGRKTSHETIRVHDLRRYTKVVSLNWVSGQSSSDDTDYRLRELMGHLTCSDREDDY